MTRRLFVAMIIATIGSLLGSTLPAAADPGPSAGAVLETVSVTGTYTPIAVDDPEAGTSRIDSVVQVGSELVTLPEELATELVTGQQVALSVEAPQEADTKTEIVAAIQADTAEIQAAVPTAQVQTPSIAGPHTLTVLPVYWSGAGSKDSQTPTTLNGVATQVASYWTTETGGAVTFPAQSIKVRNWLPIAAPSGCDYTTIRNRALAAAGLDSPGTRQHVLIYFREQATCQWIGLASISGGNIWINGYASPDGWEHEFGHNLGLGHANAGTCGTVTIPALAGSRCTSYPYVDYDVMGYARYGNGHSLNAALADVIGTLRNAPVATVGLTAMLAPITSVNAVRAVKIPLANSTLYVELRPRAGRNGPMPSSWAGVQIRERRVGSNESTIHLLRGESNSSEGSATVTTGRAWPIAGTQLALRVDQVTLTSAKVTILANPGVSSAAAVRPTVSPPVVRLRSGTADRKVPITVTARAGAPGIGVCHLSVKVAGRTVAARYSVSKLSVNVNVAPGRVPVAVTATSCLGAATTRQTAVTAKLVNNSAGAFAGRWSTVKGKGYFGGSARASTAKKSTSKWVFTGSQIGWVGSSRSNTGVVTVTLDGRKIAMVDTRGASANRKLIWAKAISPGRHVVTITVAGTKGRPRAIVDGFISLG